jgi:hypothetical protein
MGVEKNYYLFVWHVLLKFCFDTCAQVFKRLSLNQSLEHADSAGYSPSLDLARGEYYVFLDALINNGANHSHD